MVLDSHTHAWAAPTTDHPWTNGPLVEHYVGTFDVDVVYRAEKLLADMDETGVDEAVVVGYPIVDWTDNTYTIECAASFDRLYGIVMIDQFADGADYVLREAMATDDVLGFRLGAMCPYDQMWQEFDISTTWLRDALEEEEAFWEAAGETDAVVQALVHVDQLDQAVEMVEHYPELTYLFDHWGHADPTDDPAESAFAEFEALASNENVAVKVSEVAHMSEEEFPYRDMHDHLRWLLDTFGRERVVWGSDFPNVSDVCSYEESLEWLDHVEGLSKTDREWLTGRAFRTHVGI
jgi:predicted TIM-barrel fold metal-dependent hydrolase